jgi:hypothetical protein
MDIQKHLTELRDEALKKKLLKIIIFIGLPAYILHSCVTSPLYTIFASDVALTEYSIIFDALNDLLDLFVFFLSYAVVLYGIYRLSLKEIRPTFYLAMLLPIIKYVLKLAVSPIVDGAIKPNDLLMGLFSFGISGAFEILQFLLIIFISKSYIDKYKQMETVVAKASKTVGNESAPDMSVLPFKKMFSIENPLQRGAIVSGAVVSTFRLVMLAINDISKGIYATDLGGYLLIIGGYILELVIGVMGYMLMLYVFITIGTKDKK